MPRVSMPQATDSRPSAAGTAADCSDSAPRSACGEDPLRAPPPTTPATFAERAPLMLLLLLLLLPALLMMMQMMMQTMMTWQARHSTRCVWWCRRWTETRPPGTRSPPPHTAPSPRTTRTRRAAAPPAGPRRAPAAGTAGSASRPRRCG